MTRKGSATATAPVASDSTTLTQETPVTVTLPAPAPVDYTDLAAVTASYQAADTATKAAMRKAAETALRVAVTQGDLVTAQTVISAQGAMVAKSATKVSEPVDHAALIKTRVATLLFAAHNVLSGDVKIDGTPDDVQVEDVTEDDLFAIMNLVMKFATDDVESVRDGATKIASQKISAGRPAPRKSGGVAGHIEDVRDALTTSTFLTVAAIAKTHTDTYGTDLPSTGAVSARLDAATFDVANVTPYAKGETLPNGTTAPAAGAWFEVVA